MIISDPLASLPGNPTSLIIGHAPHMGNLELGQTIATEKFDRIFTRQELDQLGIEITTADDLAKYAANNALSPAATEVLATELGISIGTVGFDEQLLVIQQQQATLTGQEKSPGADENALHPTELAPPSQLPAVDRPDDKMMLTANVTLGLPEEMHVAVGTDAQSPYALPVGNAVMQGMSNQPDVKAAIGQAMGSSAVYLDAATGGAIAGTLEQGINQSLAGQTTSTTSELNIDVSPNAQFGNLLANLDIGGLLRSAVSAVEDMGDTMAAHAYKADEMVAGAVPNMGAAREIA